MLISEVVLMCFAVIIHFISLPHSASELNVLWPPRENRAGICCNGHFGKSLLCAMYMLKFCLLIHWLCPNFFLAALHASLISNILPHSLFSALFSSKSFVICDHILLFEVLFPSSAYF